jgi:hypothetical protein
MAITETNAATRNFNQEIIITIITATTGMTETIETIIIINSKRKGSDNLSCNNLAAKKMMAV